MAAAREEDEAARPLLLLPRSAAQEDQKWWRRWAREAGWVGYLALPMVVVNLSQYAVQVSSNMMVGHLPGVLPLSSAAIATSLANVSGFSLLAHRVAEATKKAEEALWLEKLREPYNLENDPELKDFLAELEVVHKTIDEAVDKALNNIVERVLNED